MMGSKPDLSWIDAKAIADDIVFSSINQHLSDIEMKVLQASWEEKTYDDMARIYGYSAEYLNKDVGNKLWRKLSIAVGERVTKKNFKEALGRHQNSYSQPPKTSSITSNLPFPEGSIALDSPLYVERFGVDSLCYETILKPGTLIRIKAPKLMGKTSLLIRILAHAANHQCQTVHLDLSSVDRSIFMDLDKFLRWLCYVVSRQLKLVNRLNDYWDTEILGSNDNCTAYFEEYLLPEIDCPLVLGFDDSDRLFAHAEVAEDVLGMLRSWHEKGKVLPIWQQLRLILAHSTEVYIPLDINQSPFNAGLPIELQEFNSKQIEHLAQLHGLNLTTFEITSLMQMVGGHPYLVRLAMYALSQEHTTLPQLLQEAATEAGIFSHHLRRYLELLQQTPELAQMFKQAVLCTEPIELNPMQIYHLHSIGLVKRINNHVVPLCNLYREYFSRVLTE